MNATAAPAARIDAIQRGTRRARTRILHLRRAPYSLEVSNPSDMICLLLGTIVSETRYDDGPAAPFTFRAETAAYHPRGGSMRIDAQQVRHGFIAFRYLGRVPASHRRTRRGAAASHGQPQQSRRRCDPASGALCAPESAGRTRAPGRSRGRYSASRRSPGSKRRGIWKRTADKRKRGISDAEFSRARTVRDGQHRAEPELRGYRGDARSAGARRLRRREGAHRVIRFIDSCWKSGSARRRRCCARAMRRLCDVAAACGFSSQQHMTALFSERLGTTPLRFRKNAQ